MKNTLTKEFIKFVAKELNMKSLPKKIAFVSDDYAQKHLTFGTYDMQNDVVLVANGSRHIADVLRTLAHELVHHKQREDGKVLNGQDGSDIENEANAKAGELMRKFRTVHPEMFGGAQMNEHKVQKILIAAKTGEPQKIDEVYVDGFTAKLLVTVMHKLSPENKKKFYNESIEKMVAMAYQLVTR